jgi:predicted protein tyrosine phosphatase
MKTILALGKIDFDKMMSYNGIDDSNVEEKDVMIVSICSPKDDNQPYIAQLSKESYFKQEHSNVKILYFGDYSEEQVLHNPYAFTKKQAKELYEFIKRNSTKSCALIHCGGGYSRSAGVATFVFDNYGEMSFDEFKRKNPQIVPNQYVLKLLNEAKRNDSK